MRIAIVQTHPEFGKMEANVASALRLAGSVKADLYVLPELFNSGYNFSHRDEVEAVAEPADGPTCRSVIEFARQMNAFVAYGFAERGEHTYNSACIVGAGGVVGLYRKVHLFDREKLFFAPGDLGFPVFELPFGRVGLMVCFDWIFPESARTLAMDGAQLIAHPSNLVLPYCPDAMVTRCLENRIFAATANRVGREDREGYPMRFIGQSEVVSPAGKILVRLGSELPDVAVVDVDIAAATNKQLNDHNHIFNDRRPDQYRAG